MYYYTHNVGDWAMETQGLSLAHLGAYVRLIDRYVSTEKPIKTQWVSLAFASEDVRIATEVLEAFFEPADGVDGATSGWVHPQYAKEIEAFKAKAERNRENGKRGGRPRKAKETDSVSSGFSTESEREAGKSLTVNRKPITVNQEESASALSSAPAQEASPAPAKVSKAPRRKAETACPFLPGQPIPDEYRDIAVQAGVADPQRCFESFVMHALSHDRRLARWDMGFRTWAAKEKDFGAKASMTRAGLEAIKNPSNDIWDHEDLSKYDL